MGKGINEFENLFNDLINSLGIDNVPFVDDKSSQPVKKGNTSVAGDKQANKSSDASVSSPAKQSAAQRESLSIQNIISTAYNDELIEKFESNVWSSIESEYDEMNRGLTPNVFEKKEIEVGSAKTFIDNRNRYNERIKVTNNTYDNLLKSIKVHEGARIKAEMANATDRSKRRQIGGRVGSIIFAICALALAIFFTLSYVEMGAPIEHYISWIFIGAFSVLYLVVIFGFSFGLFGRRDQKNVIIKDKKTKTTIELLLYPYKAVQTGFILTMILCIIGGLGGGVGFIMSKQVNYNYLYEEIDGGVRITQVLSEDVYDSFFEDDDAGYSFTFENPRRKSDKGEVVSIGPNVMSKYAGSNFRCILMPDTVTEICDYAFDDVDIIGGKVPTDGGNFEIYNSLPLPASLKTVGENAFNIKGTQITSIVIPEGTTKIGYNAFRLTNDSNTRGTIKVTIPESVTEIDNRAFYFSGYNVTINCTASSKPSGWERGWNYSTRSSVQVNYGTAASGDFEYTAYANTATISKYTGTSSTVSIPSRFGTRTVTAIGEFAFSDNPNITSVIIPSTVTTIANSAFYNCIGLNTVSLTSGLNTIGRNAFDGCSALASITIPNSVETIGGSAFANCTTLESITLPFIGQNNNGSGASYFGYIFGASSYIYQFNAIPYSLKNVTLTRGTSISSYAFYNCVGLNTVSLADGLNTIGNNAFNGCSALTSITIPNSVETIGGSAFANCTALESITLPFIGENKDGSGVFYFGYVFGASDYINQSNTVPNSLKRVNITGGTDVSNYAFYGCSALTSISISDSVESIGEYAFYNCVGLNTVSLADGLNNIGNYAFYGCSALTSITIPNSVESIGDYAFYNCIGLNTVSLTDGLNTIGNNAFYGCSALTSITIPNSVETIGDSAFANCTKLESITLPFIGQNKDGSGASYFGYIFGASSYSSQSNTVPNTLNRVNITGGTDVSNNAFYGCSALTSITIPNSVESIGDSAFYNCIGLNTVSLADGLNNIGNYAFYGCSALTSITIPNSVETIGNFAFYDCIGLNTVSLADGLNTIGNNAFDGCSALTSITIPNSVQTIGEYAFNSSNLIIYVEIAESNKPSGWDSDCFYSYGLLLYDINNRDKNTYTFITNEGSSVADITDHVLWSAPVTTRERYRFTGWYTDADCEGSPISYPYIGAETTFYAGWLYEGGTSFEDAEPISVGSSVIVDISSPGKSVYYKFTVTNTELGQQRSVRIYTETSGSRFDNYGYLYNSSETLLKSDDDSGGNGNFLIATEPLSPGTYYVRVKAYSSSKTGQCRLVLAYS